MAFLTFSHLCIYTLRKRDLSMVATPDFSAKQMRGSRESVDGVLTSRCSRTGGAGAYPVWIVRAGEGAQKILTLC